MMDSYYALRCTCASEVYSTVGLFVCLFTWWPCSLLGTFPLDTTKTRLQVQGQHKDILCFKSKYRGMIHALLRISQEEGVSALYKG